MENTMMLPASYCVMNEEEMTYTSGGATVGQAVLACIVWPYAWFKGCMAIREYRQKDPDNWMNSGMDALAKDMEKSVPNAVFDIACAYSFVAVNVGTLGVGLIPTALIIFG